MVVKRTKKLRLCLKLVYRGFRGSGDDSTIRLLKFEIEYDSDGFKGEWAMRAIAPHNDRTQTVGKKQVNNLINSKTQIAGWCEFYVEVEKVTQTGERKLDDQ